LFCFHFQASDVVQLFNRALIVLLRRVSIGAIIEIVV
jgi:hypothetical protein